MNFLISFLKNHNVITEKYENVYRYAAEILLHKTIVTLMTLAIGFGVGAPVEAITVYITFRMIRRMAGGYHADSPQKCMLISAMLIAGTALVAKWVKWNALESLLIMGITDIAIILLCPVDCNSKRIDEADVYLFKKRTAVRVMLLGMTALCTSFLEKGNLLRAICCGELLCLFLTILGKWHSAKLRSDIIDSSRT